MISSAELLSNFEHCERWGYWSLSWQRHRMTPMQMFHEAVRLALVEDVPDPGEAAGEHFMTLARDRGLDITDSINTYRCAINHAAAADLVVTALRKNNRPWLELPNRVNGWKASSMMDADGALLRRFLAVSSWNEDREFFEKHSWYVLGDIAHYMMPMQLVVCVLGPMSGGRRRGPWSKAQLHPHHSELRFRVRRRRSLENFKETWLPIYREEHDEIDREKWLACMAQDEVLQESLFVMHIPVPETSRLDAIRELAERQLARAMLTGHIPDKQLSTCHNPIAPCPFRACCWNDPEQGPEAGGYDRI
jgi:hypothetical protein